MKSQAKQKKRISGLTAALFLALPGLITAASTDPPWAAAEEIDLIPTPTTLELSETRHPLKEFSIVVDSDSPLAKTAAKEINRRANSLGAPSLTVDDTWQDGPLLLLGTSTEALPESITTQLRTTPDDLDEQAYTIQSLRHNETLIVLALGQDPQGLLYAAMTLRRLIQSNGDTVHLREAYVRDAPAFKRRSIGRFWTFNERHPVRYIRWLARHKVNVINIRGSWLYDRQGDARERVLDRIRVMTEAASDYGMRCRMTFKTDIKEVVTDEEWAGCVKRRGGERWYCWTAEKAHRTKAKRIARFLKDAGITMFTLHAADGGFYEDPETWSERCSRCRKAYGDNRGKASAYIFNLYQRILNEVHPACEYEVVAYPYHYQFAAKGLLENPEAFKAMPGPWHYETFKRFHSDREYGRKQIRRLKAHHQTLEKALPDDVLITFREGGRSSFRGATRLWKQHPLNIWVYFYRTDAWRGMWEPQARLIKTWHRPEHRDMFFNAFVPFGYGPVRKWTLAAASAEYSWNIDQPDASPSFTLEKRYYDEGVRTSTDYQRDSLIPRILRRFWGPPGMAFHRLLADNVSFYYVADPANMLGRAHHERFEDPYAYYADQVETLKASVPKVDRMIRQLDRQSSDLRNADPAAYEYALILYWMVHKAAAKGEIELARHRAATLAQQGMPQQAQATLKGLLKRLPSTRKALSQMEKRVVGDPRLRWDPNDLSPRWAGHGFKAFTIKEEQAKIKAQLKEIQ